MTEEATEAQPGSEAPKSDLTPLAQVAKLLRDNPETLGSSEEAPPGEEAQERGGELPAAGESSQQESEQVPTLSEDGLGIQQPEESGDAVVLPMLQTLAEKAGLTLEEVYATSVALGDGQAPTTLGDLKDQFSNYSRLVEKTEVFESSRTEFENNMIRSRAELAEIVKLLPQGSITDELVQQATQTYAETQQRELTALVGIKPEWKDPQAYELARGEILETASEYGFNRADLDAVIDHRLIKLLHDFHTMRVRFREANAGVKRVIDTSRQRRVTSAKGAPNKGLNKQLEEAKQSSSTADKVAAVSRLLQQQ